MSGPITILVVDDNPTNLKLAADVLEYEGYKTLRACNAEQARQLLVETRPGLILLDIQMPDVDGLTLTRLLKADPVYRQIPIVALTAFAMIGDERKALEAGCDAYLPKPIESRKLSSQLTEILQCATAVQKTTPEP